MISSFKIRWNAHLKRINFDVHKLAGAIATVFLVFTFFTGFCWSFGEFINPMIYAATFQQIANYSSLPQSTHK
ncbi:PepSY-associated TM helix domain-containing protein [Nostoc sp.]|uniref:PepSY-associated TM helix domain-containing protein n=1 Tax=Nostoc sp. TaxID=1180 RepID=UPI002FFC7DC7